MKWCGTWGNRLFTPCLGCHVLSRITVVVPRLMEGQDMCQALHLVLNKVALRALCSREYYNKHKDHCDQQSDSIKLLAASCPDIQLDTRSWSVAARCSWTSV